MPLNTLNEWLTFIEQRTPQNVIKLGLDNVKAVANKLNLKELASHIVTIAGTNGKGSTVKTLQSLISQSGVSVGSYTSPHMFDFNERIQINGKNADDDLLVSHFKKVEEASIAVGITLTYFEFTTLVAMSVFNALKVEYILLEVGLGGRLDATNAFIPSSVILTQIGLDHQHMLGNTLEEITNEKLGVLREKIPVVLASEKYLPIVSERLNRLNNQVYAHGVDFFTYKKEQLIEWTINNKRIHSKHPLLPIQSIAAALAWYFKVFSNNTLSEDELSNLIENVSLPGRFNLIKKDRLFILDVAHNEDALGLLVENLNKRGFGKVDVLLGLMEDKDLSAIIGQLSNLTIENVYCYQPEVPRALPADTLKQAIEDKLSENVSVIENLSRCIESLNCSTNTPLVICGSFYVVSPALEALSRISASICNNEDQSVLN